MLASQEQSIRPSSKSKLVTSKLRYTTSLLLKQTCELKVWKSNPTKINNCLHGLTIVSANPEITTSEKGTYNPRGKQGRRIDPRSVELCIMSSVSKFISSKARFYLIKRLPHLTTAVYITGKSLWFVSLWYKRTFGPFLTL